MDMSYNFLCEIGTEEIPAGYLPQAVDAAKKKFAESLQSGRIDCGEIRVYATPRRIVILAAGLAENQRMEEAEMKGPSAKAAYDSEGKPTRALEGFLSGNGITLADVYTRQTEKGDYLFAKKLLQAKRTDEILPEIMKGIVDGVPFPKRMRWSDKKITFPRPIAYFVLMFNDRVIPFEMDGIRSSNRTRGHYIQHNHFIEVDRIANYRELLLKNGVLIDQEERKELIRKALHESATRAGGVLVEDEELLDTVTYLVEHPHVVTCEFDKSYLRIPDIVLIAEMREHQKYFSVRDTGGSLINRFLVISNNPETEHVRAGNVRVISARFNDAGFFYEEDRKKKLADRVDQLKNVLFHKELGSIYDKVERMLKLAEYIGAAMKLDPALMEKARRAILLCKTDLITAMVIEFPSLQGRVGKIYALSDGEDPEVAEAIDEHYRPRFSGDAQPSGTAGVITSLTEKIDNIFGSFSVGNIPKGSADPYALRRQANAIVELLIKNGINIALKPVLESAAPNYRDGAGLVDKVVEFIMVRAKTIFTENGFSHDEIDACLSTGKSDFLELFRLAQSVNHFRKDEKFSELLLGFKRMNNIVSAFRRENRDYALKFDAALLQDKEEKDLYEFFHSRVDVIAGYIAASSYIELFKLITESKSVIDSFFDKVLVMDKRVEVRDNRLHLLEGILGQFKGLLDFSKIADK